MDNDTTDYGMNENSRFFFVEEFAEIFYKIRNFCIGGWIMYNFMSNTIFNNNVIARSKTACILWII